MDGGRLRAPASPNEMIEGQETYLKRWLKLFEEPIESCGNKFVITEDGAYFVPFIKTLNKPGTIDILAHVFDLEDPEVYSDVSGRLVGGRIIRGYYDPSTKEVVIMGPAEPSAYLRRRITDVFGAYNSRGHGAHL